MNQKQKTLSDNLEAKLSATAFKIVQAEIKAQNAESMSEWLRTHIARAERQGCTKAEWTKAVKEFYSK